MKAISSTKEIKAILRNRTMHDRIAQNYDTNHREIYNPGEQKRIKESLQNAMPFIRTGSEKILALDYGAGTGNITNHLLNFGFHVIATDVSSVSLKQMVAKLGSSNKLQTGTLNGKDLSNFKDSTFDMVTTYSVLHHVPGPLLRKLRLIYDEGDIHTSKEDHIAWDDIKSRLLPSCEILIDQDHLVCREEADPAPVWTKWRDTTVDMKLIVAGKKTVPAVPRP